MCDTLEISVCVLRIYYQQTHISNVAIGTTESYNRVGVFILFLDNFVE